jgi:hypothetical protein
MTISGHDTGDALFNHAFRIEAQGFCRLPR